MYSYLYACFDSLFYKIQNDDIIKSEYLFDSWFVNAYIANWIQELLYKPLPHTWGRN